MANHTSFMLCFIHIVSLSCLHIFQFHFTFIIHLSGKFSAFSSAYMAQDLLYLILTEDDDEDDVHNENCVFQGAEGVKKVNNLDVKLCTCMGVSLTIGTI